MNLPFSLEQFLEEFRQYNTAVWPVQVVLNLLALTAIALSFKGESTSRLIAGILALLWAWTGIAYHWVFFSSINKVAVVFGLLCVLEATLFVVFGVVKGTFIFRRPTGLPGALGALAVGYALLIYPAVGYILGHIYPQAPTFGAPCPTTIFTLGILLWTTRRFPRTLIVIPALWSLVGSSAAFTLGIWEDVGLLVAGVVGTVAIMFRKRAVSMMPAA